MTFEGGEYSKDGLAYSARSAALPEIFKDPQLHPKLANAIIGNINMSNKELIKKEDLSGEFPGNLVEFNIENRVRLMNKNVIANGRFYRLIVTVPLDRLETHQDDARNFLKSLEISS